MGWFNDDFPGHDGYMVGVEHDAEHGDYREFSRQSLPAGWAQVLLAEQTLVHSAEGCSATSAASVDLRSASVAAAILTVPLRFVAMGCECGWRSPRLHAPMGLVYVAFEVEWDARNTVVGRREDFEKSMISLWAAHLHQAPIEPENIRLPSEFRSRK